MYKYFWMFYKIDYWLFTLVPDPGSWGQSNDVREGQSHHWRLWRSRWHQGEEQIIFLSDGSCLIFLGEQSSIQSIAWIAIFSSWNQTFEYYFRMWCFLICCWKINLKKTSGKEILCPQCLFQNIFASWLEPELFLSLVSRLYQLSWRLM